jgi:protein SCO1/2
VQHQYREPVVGSKNVMNRQLLRARAMRPLAALTLVAFAIAACGSDSEPTPVPAAAVPAPIVTAVPAETVAPPPEVTTTPQTAGSASSPIGDPRPAPELADLVLPDGSAFDLASLEGSNVLVYFGYTHCPDVCPETLGQVYGVFAELPETQALFVTVDPERDTPEFLEEWTTYLPDSVHAVTGTPGAIRRAADNYGVRYARVETTSTSGYTMSHTAQLYLIDEDGQLLLAYPYGTAAAEIIGDLETLAVG